MHLKKIKRSWNLIPLSLFCLCLSLSACADKTTAEYTQPDPGLNAEESSTQMDQGGNK